MRRNKHDVTYFWGTVLVLLFIHSFNKFLLSNYYVPDVILDVGI